MKKFIYASIIITFMGLIYFQGIEPNVTERQISEKNNILPQEVPRTEINTLRVKVVHEPKVSGKSNLQVRNPASKEGEKQKESFPLDAFSKTEIEFFDGRYLLVDGAYASLDPSQGQKKIADIGGFLIYEQRDMSSLQVVYDVVKKQYGVFTGEIIAKGNYIKALPLIEKSSFDIVYKNDLIQQIIFKVENVQDLSSIESLKDLPGVILVPDIKSARARRM